MRHRPPTGFRMPDRRTATEFWVVRHGESTWNAEGLFTGWVDVPLSERGAAEAGRGGTLLAEQDLLPDIVHTSFLRRAIQTANATLALRGGARHPCGTR